MLGQCSLRVAPPRLMCLPQSSQVPLYYYQPNSPRAETIFLLSFVSQIVIEIKFFSASPRLRGATGFLRSFSVSQCLRGEKLNRGTANSDSYRKALAWG